jgi:hypothetical protein
VTADQDNVVENDEHRRRNNTIIGCCNGEVDEEQGTAIVEHVSIEYLW